MLRVRFGSFAATAMKNSIVLCMALLSGVAAKPIHAEIIQVPVAGVLTLQDAVAAAEASGDSENIIEIIESPLYIDTTVTIDNDITPGTLTIRPGAGLSRAVVAMFLRGDVPMFEIHDIGATTGVTLQDLDILLDWTHFQKDLVRVVNSHSVTIERCRIGSAWPSELPNPGTSVLYIFSPFNVIVRNCILFSYFKGNYDYGIHAQLYRDERGLPHSLFLYNNDVADYKVRGIWVDDGVLESPDSLVLLRNNVVVNHPDWADEPIGYYSDVNQVRVVESHNVAFADAAATAEDLCAGCDSLFSDQSLRRPRADALAGASFVTPTWVRLPDPDWWDPNTDFFRLLDGAGHPLHDAAADWGQTVESGLPDVSDIALLDDIESQSRPGGAPRHTDRGADQLEPGIALDGGGRHVRNKKPEAADH